MIKGYIVKLSKDYSWFYNFYEEIPGHREILPNEWREDLSEIFFKVNKWDDIYKNTCKDLTVFLPYIENPYG